MTKKFFKIEKWRRPRMVSRDVKAALSEPFSFCATPEKIRSRCGTARSAAVKDMSHCLERKPLTVTSHFIT